MDFNLYYPVVTYFVGLFIGRWYLPKCDKEDK
jgi:hypothetical protein